MAWVYGQPVHRTTERYIVRSAAPDDVGETYISWFRDSETMQFVDPELARLNREQHRAIVAAADNKSRMLLLIESRVDSQPIGLVRVQLEPRHQRAQTSVIIGEPSHRGRGAMIEVHRAVRVFLFEQADIQKVSFNVYGSHDLMLRQIRKLNGVVAEGVLRRHERVAGIGWQDIHLFAMFRGD
jgi:RimJ/RimL family protein N-acetyltransferase